jgi:hypothetical protein
MSTNILTASQQWANRPKDERFTSLQDIHAAALADRESCRRAIVPASELRAEANGQRLILAGKTASAQLNNWTYSQLAAIAGAPASYLRELPAALAADCINVGLRRLSDDGKRERHALLLRNNPDAAADPTLPKYLARAINSDRYSRVWDETLTRYLAEHQERHPEWQLPMSWNNIREGAYRGDRDAFIYMTNGGSIIEDPTLMKAWQDGSHQGNGQMYRGIILRNSEVGAASFEIQSFLFRFTCGNHIVWHATNHQITKRRHVGLTETEALRMIARALGTADQSAAADQRTIAALAAMPYGKTQDDCTAQLNRDGLTQKDAAAAYAAAVANEHQPRSVWGIANGITRHSQTYQNQDDRHDLDCIAGAILARARKAVAA